MIFHKSFLPTTIKAYTGLPLFDLKAVTLHWVGPYPNQTPSIVRNWWLTSNLEASAHFIIKDEDCMQVWPTDVIAWHCGNSYGNKHTIGIEVVPKNVEGEFSDLSIQTLKMLLDTRLPSLPLCRHFDWGTERDPSTGDITKFGKDCPKFYCDEEKWLSLLDILERPRYNVVKGA